MTFQKETSKIYRNIFIVNVFFADPYPCQRQGRYRAQRLKTKVFFSTKAKRLALYFVAPLTTKKAGQGSAQSAEAKGKR
jgi:hypothetical protein